MTPAEPIELMQGADGVYVEAPPRRQPKKRKARPGATAAIGDKDRTPVLNDAAALDQAAPYLRVDVFALRALDHLFLGAPEYQAVRSHAARVISRALAPARIERGLRQLERRLCR